MAYYEFFNLPVAQGWEQAAKEPTDAEERPGKNEWSEAGGSQNLRISFNLSSTPNERGWIGTGPRFATAVISRDVRMHSAGDDDVVSPNVAVGDLLLYRVALLSTDAKWTAASGARESWPGAYLEFDTQNGVRMTATLRRLAIQNWTLRANLDGEGKLQSLRETLVFRAWVIDLRNPVGKLVQMALSDSAHSKANG